MNLNFPSITRRGLIIPDYPLGREGMASGFASGLPHPRQAHIRDYGREAGVARRRKTAARTRVGPQGRLMDNPGLLLIQNLVRVSSHFWVAKAQGTFQVH